ncbi:hypothetical protein [uncultured Bacteroides sp.]|uniref:hypothetical protein n=1 Tax=uncultured Bacteroides sp. TaxID=162156 RepID=UPI00280A6F12|nr:hypothetical protein [uncultured Bacteroides sp.]
MMKSTFRMLQCSILSLMSVFAGCNSEVFIDEFLTDVPTVSLSETENEVTVRFDTDNWSIIDINYLRSDVSVFATDLEGENGKSLPFEEGETGIVHCRNTFLDFQVEKRNGRELHLIAGENLYDRPFEAAIRVGNRYEEKMIQVSFAPTRKYQVDSVAYDWSQFSFYDNMLEPVDEMVVNTLNSTQPVTVCFYPYRNSARTVEFSMLGSSGNIGREDVQQLLEDSLSQVEIPDVVNGVPGLYGTKVSFCVQEQRLDAGLDKNLGVEKKLGPGKKVRLEVFTEMKMYNIPYKVYLSNSFTGKKMIFSGTLFSSTPFDYLIVPFDITNEDE